MSCATQGSQPIRLTVTVGNLPEGYCPPNFQQFATDFAARLIVTPSQGTSTFVSGSIEPTSNVGPWLKNCLEWFFFDDATGRYFPGVKGGFDTLTTFAVSGNFIVPDDIYKIQIEGWGGGGGGSNKDAGTGKSGAGGGGGGYGLKILAVVPAQVITVTIGAGGAGGSPGLNGANTTISTMTCGGGIGGSIPPNSIGGDGGVTTGADIGINGGTGDSKPGGTEAFSDNGGNGGDSPRGGSGGAGSETAGKRDGKLFGGGGAGGHNSAVGAVGGNGANGYAVIWY